MDTQTVNPPASLLAELTHRCPLHCVYCSNPLQLAQREVELPTVTWLRIMREAADLGVLEAHFSGGEPLLRPDVVTLVEGASRFDLYTNVITSGVGLTRARARALKDAGLGSVQLSIQAADAISNRAIAGQDVWRPKLQAAQHVPEAGLPLSVNVVLHRRNLHQVTALLELAESLGAERVELANAQYYGWALVNRDYLLPSREMLAEAKDAVARFRARASTAMEILWVIPDYYADFPKPCMNGWGQTFITVAPDEKGLAVPGRIRHSRAVPSLGHGLPASMDLVRVSGLQPLPRFRMDV